ncbi:MAG TPA: cellulose synthase operon protein YhjQ/BcsQ [Candidatus Omnitrophota bacterium]|nr:cellulose synthase operon protein YhjQ/BcsQ [Candidatus Omnitrophota bacterium]HRZ14116.1 cellulose synthase operon protein YhjQ/BcsQ [Candidatus Omnitrophota bacterium]
MEQLEQLPETTMRDYLRVLFRQKAVIITCFITVMITVIIGNMLRTPEYEAQVKMLISAEKQVESPYYRELLGSRNMEAALTQAEIVKSFPVLRRTIEFRSLQNFLPMEVEERAATPLKALLLKLERKMLTAKLKALDDQTRGRQLAFLALERLKSRIDIEPIRDTNLFLIKYRDYDPMIAAAVANVVSRAYILFDLEQQVAELQTKYGDKHSTVVQIQESISKIEQRERPKEKMLFGGQLLPNDVDAIGPASVKVIEQALPPLRPVGPSGGLIIILAIFMSLFLGGMLAFMFEYMDQTFKSPQEVERYLALPSLGFIPKKGKSRSFDTLAEQILLISKDKNLKSLLFTTAAYGEDAADIVVNLGRSLAEKWGLKVLVVDANFRQLTLKKFENKQKENAPGLVDVIEEKVTFEKTVQTISKNLALLPAGKTELNPVTVLDSNRMNTLLADVVRSYDLVLISAPDLTHRDSILLCSQVDGVLLVVDEGKTRKQVVRNALFPLAEKKANIMGIILNNRTFFIPRAIYNWV